jgi:predicted alpha/beta-fold hydrolase
MAAYFKLSPRDNDEGATTRCREIMTMTGDGATVAVDWEIPPGVNPNDVLQGDGAPPRPVVARPVVVIVHGINNDAEFGYIRSQMRACTDRGWIAAGFNMRACGKGVPVTTPRGYNGAFTGDIRCVVQHIAARLSTDGIGGDNNASNNRMSSCIFLVGHSLGANLVTKYLGEEGFSGTLPPCVAGGVGLGNPLLMNGVKKIDRLFSPIMALGAKKTILEHWFSIQPMTRSPSFRSAIHRALLAPTLAAFDNAMAPIFVRNEPTYPFSTRIGYESAEDYYNDASSFRHVPHIPIPTLQVVAADDFLVFVPFRGRLRYCLQNPNVMVVETKCGGHLGWQESPPDRSRLGLLGSSWADVVTCDFIEAVLDQRERRLVEDEKAAPKTQTCDIGSAPHAAAARFDDGSKLLRVHSRL